MWSNHWAIPGADGSSSQQGSRRQQQVSKNTCKRIRTSIQLEWSTKSRTTAPDDGLNFYNDGQEDETPPTHQDHVNATKGDGGGASTMIGNNGTPVVCFECGKNHYRTDCAKYKARMAKKKDTSSNQGEREDAQQHVTIGETDDAWGPDIDYGDFMFIQFKLQSQVLTDHQVLTEPQKPCIDYTLISQKSKSKLKIKNGLDPPRQLLDSTRLL